jgi:hypothetical protein
MTRYKFTDGFYNACCREVYKEITIKADVCYIQVEENVWNSIIYNVDFYKGHSPFFSAFTNFTLSWK